MKTSLLFLIISIPSFLFSQSFLIKNAPPATFNGTGDGLRSVWFSENNTMINGDFKSIYSWGIDNHNLTVHPLSKGMPVNSSTINKEGTVWVLGQSIYADQEKMDIMNMHSVISIGNPISGEITDYRTDGFDVWNVKFIENTTKVAAIISKEKTYINAAVIYDLETKSIVRTIANGASMNDVMSSITVSEDSSFIAIGYAGKNKRIEIYDFESGKKLKTIKAKFEVTGLEIENGILCAGGSETVLIVKLEDLSVVKTINTILHVSSMALSPDGKTVAIGDYKGGCALIDIKSENSNRFSDYPINCLTFSSDGKKLAAGLYVTLHLTESTSVAVWTNENKIVVKK